MPEHRIPIEDEIDNPNPRGRGSRSSGSNETGESSQPTVAPLADASLELPTPKPNQAADLSREQAAYFQSVVDKFTNQYGTKIDSILPKEYVEACLALGLPFGADFGAAARPNEERMTDGGRDSAGNERASLGLAAYEQIISQHPDNIVAKVGRAAALRDLGRLDDALAAYDTIIAEFPHDVVPKLGRAELLRELGRTPEAALALREAAANHPENVDAGIRLAEILREMGRLEEAATIYREISQSRDSRVASIRLAELMREMGRLDEAAAIYRETTARYPELSGERNPVVSPALEVRKEVSDADASTRDANGKAMHERDLHPSELEWFQQFAQQYRPGYCVGAALHLAFQEQAVIADNGGSDTNGPLRLFLCLLEIGFDDVAQPHASISLPLAISRHFNLSREQLDKMRREAVEQDLQPSSTGPTFGSDRLRTVLNSAVAIRAACTRDDWLATRHVVAAMLLGFHDVLDRVGFNRMALKSTLRDHLPTYANQDNALAWEETLAQIGGADIPESAGERSNSIRGDALAFQRTASDEELCLNVEKYAAVLARLFRLPDPGEFCVAIFGHWGRGKTFLMERTAKALNDGIFAAEAPHETVFFSAWKYPSRPEVWIHLYKTIFKKLQEVGWWHSIAHVVRAGIARHGTSKLWGLWAALMFSAMPKGWLLHGVEGYVRGLEWSVGVGALVFLRDLWLEALANQSCFGAQLS